ncbi:hypothetical protein IGI04_035307 [Brassica rapa subsp. trilocularis]|uniref:Uncharacterized protein n=1 Tax=Brassica rapa subsp. trilocularis TaxID=1813537 RepID=A0ABQ7LB76_BRACM|nr:hypothetical protein IGI04_035307 [Brassica rapa subsp. trilocularis]
MKKTLSEDSQEVHTTSRRLPGSPDDRNRSPDDFQTTSRRLPGSPDDFQTTSRRLPGSPYDRNGSPDDFHFSRLEDFLEVV